MATGPLLDNWEDIPPPLQSRLVWRVPTKAKIRSLGFLPNGNVVSVEDGTWTTTVEHYNLRDGSSLGELFPQVVLNPGGLSVHRPTGKVVTRAQHSDSIGLYTPNGTTYDCLKGKIDSPHGITFMQDESVVVGRLQWTTRSLVRLRLSGDILWKKDVPHAVHYLATDNNGRIIASDSSPDSKIYVSSPEGNLLLEFPEKKDPMILQDARDVCVDSANRILVADQKKNAVLLFSPEGKFIREVIQFEGVKYVTLYKDRFLAVAKIQKELSLYEVNLAY